ncbi:hypothetical protein OS493_023494 [Desmophyllum pertusum]|uniref:Cation-dependent mannose-6-phosphate receptor n=1 Tax=Desmophyllum pertusum TaxID=174260 RepID=A0A9X0D266_9CNID|nr:hypothetical protein OS493_023494 [Desmophyllum pertusum]
MCFDIYRKAAIGDSVFTVALQCNETVEGQVDAMTIATNKYGTVLHSKYACPSPPSSGTSTGLSIGSILVITFSCIIIVYIMCGILLNKYARQVEGKEVFPNYSFWADFPYLIKDGCVFTFECLGRLCGKDSSRGGYASI